MNKRECERSNGGHSKQEICICWDGVTGFISIAENITFCRTVSLNVNSLLLTVALAGLDEEELGFPCQRGAMGSIDTFHQSLDLDRLTVHTVNTPLLAVAEDAANQIIHRIVVPSAE
ncbi:hypothetical protein CesoFtcFv8_013851 [Champsocephalus esox]|uniref:Uncharacterized protein n=1 Tax=Champsocephalus esox TaxID=159716 RepID=A0AAN8BSI3_9TELE|nr:hypothetical protein CesoFtcFv8_013851 [Champsocephalus esox]